MAFTCIWEHLSQVQHQCSALEHQQALLSSPHSAEQLGEGHCNFERKKCHFANLAAPHSWPKTQDKTYMRWKICILSFLILTCLNCYYQAGYCYHQIPKALETSFIILYPQKKHKFSKKKCYDSTDRANRSAFERLPVLAPGCQDPQGRIVASVHQLGYKKHPP